MKKIKAKPISYDASKKRNKATAVTAIVIHYTGNKGDTAEGNALYFANGNMRKAGAHFFVDRKGVMVKSIDMERTAWSVGGDHRSGRKGEAKFYKKITNANSVSIELCDIKDQYPSPAQLKAVKDVIKYIRKYCPQAKQVVRHYDVNGKLCPATMVDTKTWNKFLKDIGEK